MRLATPMPAIGSPKGCTVAVGIFQLKSMEPGFTMAEWGFAIGSEFWGTGIFAEGARLGERSLLLSLDEQVPQLVGMRPTDPRYSAIALPEAKATGKVTNISPGPAPGDQRWARY
mgnify:CR=1 FL=1